MSRCILSLCICASCLGGCSKDTPSGGLTSDQGLFGVKLQTANRAASDIRRRKKEGQDVYADCKTAQMLFVDDLGRHGSTQASKVARTITRLCKDVKPR